MHILTIIKPDPDVPITIDDSGYNLSGPDWANDLIGGGKKDQSWLEDRHNEVPPDTGWDDLFDKCKQ